MQDRGRRERRGVCLGASALLTLTLGAGTAMAQAQELEHPVAPVQKIERVHIVTGVRPNLTKQAGVVYRDLVRIDNAAWLRLYFGNTVLEEGSFIRVTSMLDGEVQELDADTLAMWSWSTAYFNGDSVMVELVAGPDTSRNQFIIENVARELVLGGTAGTSGECGICGATDDRVPSSETWSARMVPAGCTASVYTTESCMVSAGHCVDGGDVVQFNVPNSNANCTTNNPPIADQFPIINVQFVNGGVGNDWAAMLAGDNNLGQHPYERYGELRPIAAAPPAVGQNMGMWGYGVDPDICTRSQTQQTHSGNVTSVFGSWFEYAIDLRGGNSGSALIRNGEIVGIATHCPCPNVATRVDLAAFAQARDIICSGVGGPTNDDCADAEPIFDGNTAYSTVGATTDGPASPANTCNDFGENQTHQDIWYEYVATCTGDLTVTTCDDIHGQGDPSYDTDLVIYGPYANAGQINCNSLLFLACNDDDPNNGCGTATPFSSTIVTPVTQGQTYLIRVGGWNAGAQGTGTVFIDCDGVQIVTGACCFGDGSCSVEEQAVCVAQGGTYQGDNVPCAPNPCPQIGACCFANGSCIDTTATDCATLGGTFQGVGTDCSPNPCAQPMGACCDVLTGACTLETSAGCAAIGGLYMGDGTNCSPNPCPQPTGACCFADGSCSAETAADCAAQGGTYEGDFTSCVPNPCPQPTGACCFPDGSCTEDTAADCGAQGGAYQGDGTDCNPNPCPQPPTGACCVPGGGCVELTSDACNALGGVYQGDGTTCTPDPCVITGACCFIDGVCFEVDIDECSTIGGEYQGDGTTCDPNPCPQPPDCPWDCQDDPDGQVGVNDLLQLLSEVGGPGQCDFDGSGTVNVIDLLKLLGAWGGCKV